MALALRIARLTCGSQVRFNPILSSIQQQNRCYCSNQNNSALSSPPPPQQSPSTPKPSTTKIVRQNVKGYLFTRLFNFVKNYDKVLEKNFPSAVSVYRIFFEGMKEFFHDMKRYLKISRIANESAKGPKILNRKELELYMQMPRDMVKVTPAIFLSSLPMIGYIAFPLAYMYPRAFLSSHFWTLKQKSEFQQQAMYERLSCNRPVLRCLQSCAGKGGDECKAIEMVLGLLGSGFHPTVEQLMEVRRVFTQPPYDYKSLSNKHIKWLASMYGMPGWIFRRHRLSELAYVIHYMDKAIMSEGGVHNMDPESLRKACFIRGLNPTNLSNEEMIEWLRNWVKISLSLKVEHMSFFLHLPLFLAYNHPNNWQLIYGKNKQ